MKTYQVASGVFGCDVQLTFNEAGTLINYKVMNEAAQAKGMIRLYTNEAEFLDQMKIFKMEVIDITTDITFEMAFEEYGYKVDKQPGKKAWDKKPKYKQIKAYWYMKTYKAQIKRDGVKQKYFATYINSEIYM